MRIGVYWLCRLDIAEFHPSDHLAINGPPSPGQIQITFNKPENEYLIYHPKAKRGEADFDPNDLYENFSQELASLFSCAVDDKTPSVTVYLTGKSKYLPKWFDPSKGIYYTQHEVVGNNMNYTFMAPDNFKDKDAVLYLKGAKS